VAESGLVSVRGKRGNPQPKDQSVASRMRLQKTAGTSPEVELAEALRRKRFKVEVNPTGLPGKPDIVLPRRKIAVFVHGCFWHGCRFHFTMPVHNRDWWSHKIANNKERDRRKARALRRAGWLVVTVWEHTDVGIAAARVSDAARRR